MEWIPSPFAVSIRLWHQASSLTVRPGNTLLEGSELASWHLTPFSCLGPQARNRCAFSPARGKDLTIIDLISQWTLHILFDKQFIWPWQWAAASHLSKPVEGKQAQLQNQVWNTRLLLMSHDQGFRCGNQPPSMSYHSSIIYCHEIP